MRFQAPQPGQWTPYECRVCGSHMVWKGTRLWCPKCCLYRIPTVAHSHQGSMDTTAGEKTPHKQSSHVSDTTRRDK